MFKDQEQQNSYFICYYYSVYGMYNVDIDVEMMVYLRMTLDLKLYF